MCTFKRLVLEAILMELNVWHWMQTKVFNSKEDSKWIFVLWKKRSFQNFTLRILSDATFLPIFSLSHSLYFQETLWMGNLFPQLIQTTPLLEMLSQSIVGTNFPSKEFPGIIMNETAKIKNQKLSKQKSLTRGMQGNTNSEVFWTLFKRGEGGEVQTHVQKNVANS